MKKKSINKIFLLTVLLLNSSIVNKAYAGDPHIGEVRTFAFNFCPVDWLEANGQLVPISGNEVLFTLYGTQFGGDGQSTFAMPDLRGRALIGKGQGPGLTTRSIGQAGGVETVTLNTNQIPSHSHGFEVKVGKGVTTNGEGAFIGENGIFRTNGVSDTLSMSSINTTGGSQAHENMKPYLVLTRCVAAVGVYPSQN